METTNTTTTTPTPPPGFKTSEFWLTLLATVILAVAGYLETIDATWAAIGVTVLNAIYAICRAGIKNVTTQTAKKLPLILALLCLTSLLPSCELARKSDITGEIIYMHPDTGAKGGITITNGTPTGFIRLPVRDPDTGETIAWAKLEATGKATETPVAPTVDNNSGK